MARAPYNTAAWRKLRAHVATLLPLVCPRCGEPVEPWQPWDLGHQRPVAAGGAGGPATAEHRGCNRGAGGLGTRREAKIVGYRVPPTRAWISIRRRRPKSPKRWSLPGFGDLSPELP